MGPTLPFSRFASPRTGCGRGLLLTLVLVVVAQASADEPPALQPIAPRVAGEPEGSGRIAADAAGRVDPAFS